MNLRDTLYAIMESTGDPSFRSDSVLLAQIAENTGEYEYQFNVFSLWIMQGKEKYEFLYFQGVMYVQTFRNGVRKSRLIVEDVVEAIKELREWKQRSTQVSG